MKIMYHCTRCEFLAEILEHGLEPIRPVSRRIEDKYSTPPDNQPCAVYVSEAKFKWMHWSQVDGNGKYNAGALIKLDVEGLRMIREALHLKSGFRASLGAENLL
jgi:hypothetical protein